jgi:hypothetical protein
MKIRTGWDVVGAAGRATEIVIELEESDPPDVAGTVAAYFFDCPGQSPAWRHYHMSVIHLRPIPGVKPATVERAGATHEVMLFALDPAKRPAPDDMSTWSYLRPTNFVGQLRLEDDDEARTVARLLARAIAEGALWAEPPLSGQREPWESQLRRLEEHSAGEHGVGR